MNIGIIGARKYRDRQSVLSLIDSVPADSIIVTSACKGVCTWAKEAAEERNMTARIFAPDLEKIRAWFEIPKRYYERNKELVGACDFLYAFISEEDGFAGGTRFEVEYASKSGIPVELHWENGIIEIIYQYPFPFLDSDRAFYLAWEGFFSKTNLEITGG